MRKTVAWVAITACAVLLGATGTFAQTENSRNNVNRTDELFLQALAPSNEADIQISRMAERITKDPQVKDLASKVASGDVLIQSRIVQIARKTGVTLPSKLDTPDVHLKQLLQKDSKDMNVFNAAYTQAMLDKFHAATNFFTIESQQTKNPELHTFAQQNLPRLERTMDQIETLASNLPPVTTAMK